MIPGALGRIVPPNFDHVIDHPLETTTLSGPKPVSIGVNWYEAFDKPSQARDGSYHLADASRQSLGSIRGGHCVCLVPMGGQRLLEEHIAWWKFFNQF